MSDERKNKERVAFLASLTRTYDPQIVDEIMNKATRKLKPCPFCGDEISVYKHNWPYSGYGLSHHNQECLLSVLINRVFDVQFTNKTTLIRAWNKRSS